MVKPEQFRLKCLHSLEICQQYINQLKTFYCYRLVLRPFCIDLYLAKKSKMHACSKIQQTRKSERESREKAKQKEASNMAV